MQKSVCLTAVLVFGFFLSGVTSVFAWDPWAEKPVVLLLGASYDNGESGFDPVFLNQDLNGDGKRDVVFEGPYFGGAVNAGKYLPLRDALQIMHLQRGLITTARGGSTTFRRYSFLPVCADKFSPACWFQGPTEWLSYDEQLTRALGQVTLPDGSVSASHAVIGLANNCLHSNAFENNPALTQPCTQSDFDAHAQTLVDLSRKLLAAGITPVFYNYPPYGQLDLALSSQVYGFVWTIDKMGYKSLTTTRDNALRAVPGVIIVNNAFDGFFAHNGDGLHPNAFTMLRAAKDIVERIK